VKKILLASIIACCLATTSAFAADAKLGYLDVQRVLQTSAAGTEAKEQLATLHSNYQKEINTKLEDLQKLKDELDKQGMLLTESTRSAKEKDYQQRLKEFQRFAKDAQDDMQAKEKEFTSIIIEKIAKTVQNFGQKNGYTFIFVKNEGLLFADDKVDVTEEVLKLLDANQTNR